MSFQLIRVHSNLFKQPFKIVFINGLDFCLFFNVFKVDIVNFSPIDFNLSVKFNRSFSKLITTEFQISDVFFCIVGSFLMLRDILKTKENVADVFNRECSRFIKLFLFPIDQIWVSFKCRIGVLCINMLLLE